MAKPTPGPWIVGDRYSSRAWTVDVLPIRGKSSKLIAEIPYPDQPEHIANIAIICAAPDLLEALKDMIRYLDNNGKESDVSELARLSIAKAEGREDGL